MPQEDKGKSKNVLGNLRTRKEKYDDGNGKEMEWYTGKQTVDKFEVKAANLTRKTKKINQSKNIIKVGTWNLRGTNEVGKLKQLNEVAKKYGVDIVALQEIEQKSNNTVEIGDYVYLSSGCEQKIFGMGFM
ncbi:hypothetical protein ILUMI_18531, partial [Ignelater luminosus]